jgi:hypothetical protein
MCVCVHLLVFFVQKKRKKISVLVFLMERCSFPLPLLNLKLEIPNQSQATSVTRFEDLDEDVLVNIIEWVGKNEEDKAKACQDAKAWCSLNARNKNLCNTRPQVWNEFIKKIFATDDKVLTENDKLLGQNLIFETFKNDDGDPQKTFFEMCYATKLVDFIQKLFVISALDSYEKLVWDEWIKLIDDGHVYINNTDLEEYSRKPLEEQKEFASQRYWQYGNVKAWMPEAQKMLEQDDFKEMFEDLYEKDEIFKNQKALLYKNTLQYLFEGKEIYQASYRSKYTTQDAKPTLEFFKEIGKSLGIYIVCLWKRESEAMKFKDQMKTTLHDDEIQGNLYVRYRDMQTVRLNLFYAVNIVMSPPNFKKNDARNMAGPGHEFWTNLYMYKAPQFRPRY